MTKLLVTLQLKTISIDNDKQQGVVSYSTICEILPKSSEGVSLTL